MRTESSTDRRRALLFAAALASALAPASAQSGGSAPQIVALPSGGALSVSTRAGDVVIETSAAGAAKRRLVLKRAASVSPTSGVSTRLVGEIDGKIAIIAETRDSKPGGLSRCQAGEEQFLRVLRLGARLRQTFALPLSGCIANLDLADPGVTWNAESWTLQVHWLTGPTPDEHDQTRSYIISPDGRATPAPQ